MLRQPCAATYAYWPCTATPYEPNKRTASCTEPTIAGCVGSVAMSRIVRLFPVPSSLLFDPFGPLRFLLTTYAKPFAIVMFDAFRSDDANALVPATTGCPGSSRSTAATTPLEYPGTYAYRPAIAVDVAPDKGPALATDPASAGGAEAPNATPGVQRAMPTTRSAARRRAGADRGRRSAAPSDGRTGVPGATPMRLFSPSPHPATTSRVARSLVGRTRDVIRQIRR